MPRGIPSARTNRSNAQKARREWERWEREHYTIYNQEGDEEFVPVEGEIFVPLFHYKEDKKEEILRRNPGIKRVKGTLDPRYRVSNKGNVISLTFHNIDRPYLMKQTEKLNDRDEPYMVVGSGWSVHSLVWFSFAADAIKNGYEFPKSYGIPVKEIKTLPRLAKLTGENKKKKNAEGEYWIEIHHKDLNTRNNCLDNLECDDHDIHVLIHTLNEMESDEQRMNTIREYPFAVPTMIELEGTLSISEIDAKQFLSDIPESESEKVYEAYWKTYSRFVLKEAFSVLGEDFFKRPWYMGIKSRIFEKDHLAFFSVTKNDNGGMSVKWLSKDTHDSLANKELDIYCDNGIIYLMNYTNSED